MSAHQAQAHASEPQLEMPELSRRLAREMRIAAAIADDCQDALGADESLVLAQETSMRLQGLDLLSQHLIEIGRILDRLASTGHTGEAPPELLDDVRLSDLKHRLAGAHVELVPAIETDFW